MGAAFPAAEADLATRIAQEFDKARAAWPGIDIDKDEFARELARRLGPDATVETLEKCHSTDVYLAIGCSRGDPQAIRTAQALIEKTVAGLARTSRGSSDVAAEVVAEVHRLFFVDEPPSRTAGCKGYQGRSPIQGYIKTVATRELVRHANRERKLQPLDGDDLLESLVPRTSPEIQFARKQHRKEFDESVRAAIDRLDKDDRLILNLRFVDGVSVADIAKLRQEKLSTMYRLLAKAGARLATEIRAEVGRRLGLPSDEVTSLILLVMSRIELASKDPDPASSK